ncbi:MAG: hypothetical protein ACR2QK_20160 [Acidimicrobiales bacterium]
MGTASVIYRIVLLLHIAATVVGFGGLIANGLNNARAFRSPVGQARTLLLANQSVSKIASYGMYALLALGIVLVAISDSAFSFGAPWVSAAFVVWFVMIGIFHGLVRPAVAGLLARAETLAADSPTQAMPILESDQEAGALAKRLAVGEGLVQLSLVVALVLMIWQPGN